MVNRVPEWVTPIAWTFLVLALVSAAVITVDVVRGRRHGSAAADLVWVAASLYLGPAAIVLHRRHAARAAGAARTPGTPDPSPAEVGLPGGGASALAHLIGVPLVLASGLTIAGVDLWVMIIVIGAIAIALLLGYELLAGRARGTGRRPPLARAAGAAVLTVLAFDIGMGGWMVALHYNELMPPATEGSFWFLMQLGVLLGLVTGYPAARWLVGRGGSARPERRGPALTRIPPGGTLVEQPPKEQVMSATSQPTHQHHADHGSSDGVNAMALSATLHCLTGCAIGEILGLMIGTAIGLSTGWTIVLAVSLAFLFGYALSTLPLLQGRPGPRRRARVVLAADTLSIATMELVDNLSWR